MSNAQLQAVSADYVAGLITTEEWRRLTSEIRPLEPAAEESAAERAEFFALVNELNQLGRLTAIVETWDDEQEPVWRCCVCAEPGEWPDGSIENCKIEIGDDLFCSEDCAEEAGYRFCASCEEWMDGDLGFWAGDDWFCSTDCAENAGYQRCCHCDEWHGDEDEVETNNGYWFCSPDCAHEAGYECCEHCGEWHDAYDSIVPENGYERYCSEECATYDGLFYCDRCEEWYKETRYVDSYTVHTHGEEQTWCEDCRSNYAFYCDGCNEVYDDDHYGEDGYCEDCCGGADLHEYGWTPYLNYFGGDRYQRDTPFMGYELEIDSGDDRRALVRELAELAIDGNLFGSHFWMTQDSSLNNGVEVTSHPMTLAYHEQMHRLVRAIRDIARSYGFVSHNSGNCGLHIHVNRSFFGRCKELQDAGGYKMLRALQRFERQFTIFSRREDNYWCNYRTYTDYTPEKKNGHVLYTMRDFKVKAADAASGYRHEQCLNFQHHATFEFRIFRGTLKVETLYASFGLVNGLCHTAKKRGSMFFETCTWYELRDEIVARCEEGYAKECLVEYLESLGL